MTYTFQKKYLKFLFGFSIIINLVFFALITKRLVFQYNLRKSSMLIHVKEAHTKCKILAGDIVFVGDSQTELFKIGTLFNNSTCKNRGISGNMSADVLRRIDTIALAKPSKIFICIGINDLLNSVPVDSVILRLNCTVLKIKSISPKTKVFIQSVFPCSYRPWDGSPFVQPQIIQLNSKINSIAHITFIDSFSEFNSGRGLKLSYDSGDHLHLSEQGFEKWRDIVTPYLND